MKIYKITNEVGRETYIIATNIENAIKKFKERNKKEEIEFAIKEIKCIGFCVIGE